MPEQETPQGFFSEFDLAEARKQPCPKEPAAHQHEALAKLDRWYATKPFPQAGGILVLPTGAGKTFTAVRFLCRGAISDGYKVLWLAHAHHLLEQGFRCFGDGVGLIAEPAASLAVRVVSGTPGHFPVHSIKPTDHVVIATLQTMCRAHDAKHPALESFLAACGGRLFVVFDEAHHAPAPSYRKLMFALRERLAGMYLLGLTATPTYTDEAKRGWLPRIFPQGIIHEVTPEVLIAQGILARPIAEEPRTNFTPKFDERQYQLWVGTHRDLPEDIITQLAESRGRNLVIASTYVQNRQKYGKTIIFADRWPQCEQISQFLSTRGVRTGTIYSHVDADLGSPEARNARSRDENAKVLSDFRAGNLDVVINVRMLTEGTDVPDVQTVFLTRGTTSQILVTQMVGRALRGPKFGGKPEAYIVSFVDDWRQLINWAEFGQLPIGPPPPPDGVYGKRPPLHLISIELVRQLARQMDSAVDVPVKYISLLPIGWYRVQYVARDPGSDDDETVRQLILVFEREQESFKRYIDALAAQPPLDFEAEEVHFDDLSGKIAEWQDLFFPNAQEHFGSDLKQDLFSIARHIAQNRVAPAFFEFAERDRHDMDRLAQQSIDERWDRLQEDQALSLEYNRPDRYWSTIYYTYDLFKAQFDACVRIILRHGKERPPLPAPPRGETPPIVEPPQEVKEQVKRRDGYRCVCCGNGPRGSLEVDHAKSTYFGGTNILDNLQTLCRICNREKGTETMLFRDPQTDLSGPPATFPGMELPRESEAGDAEQWRMFLQRAVNFFYRCGAVSLVRIGKRGSSFYNWGIELNTGNPPDWLESHLAGLLGRIGAARERAGFRGPESISVWAPGTSVLTCSREGGVETAQPGELPGGRDDSQVRDWFLNTDQTEREGAIERVLDQSVIALCAYENCEQLLNGLRMGDRVFAYANGVGVLAMARVGRRKAFTSGDVYRKKTAGEFHRRVTWEIIVNWEDALKPKEAKEAGFVLPVRQMLCGIEDKAFADWMAAQLQARAEEAIKAQPS